MKKKPSQKDIEALRAAGYKVKEPSVRHTFHMSPFTLDEFLKAVERRGLKVRDALDQALKDWIGKG